MSKTLKLFPWDCFVIMGALAKHVKYLKHHKYKNYNDVITAREQVEETKVAFSSVKEIPSQVEWRPAITRLVAISLHFYLRNLKHRLGKEYYNYHQFKYLVQKVKKYQKSISF